MNPFTFIRNLTSPHTFLEVSSQGKDFTEKEKTEAKRENKKLTEMIFALKKKYLKKEAMPRDVFEHYDSLKLAVLVNQIILGEERVDARATRAYKENQRISAQLAEIQSSYPDKRTAPEEVVKRYQKLQKTFFTNRLLLVACAADHYLPITHTLPTNLLIRLSKQTDVQGGSKDIRRNKETLAAIKEELDRRGQEDENRFLIRYPRPQGEVRVIDKATEALLKELNGVNPKVVDPETAQTFIERITDALRTTKDEDSRRVLTSYFSEFLDSARL